MANADFYSALQCYDGVVETDVYGPWPLFINVRITKTDVPFILDPDRPLFQLQVLPRAAFETEHRQSDVVTGLFGEDGGLSPDEWSGFTDTVRKADFRENKGRKVGAYAVKSRKAKKKSD